MPPGLSNNPQPIEIPPGFEKAHDEVLKLREKIKDAPDGDVQVDLLDLQTAVKGITPLPVETKELVEGVLGAISVPNAGTVEKLLGLNATTSKITIEKAYRGNVLSAITAFVSRSPVAAKEAAAKHQEVRAKLEKLRTSVDAAARGTAFTDFVKSLEDLRKVNPTSPQWLAMENRIRALYRVAAGNDVIEAVKTEKEAGVTPPIAADLLAVNVGPGYPNENTERIDRQVMKINGQIDQFARKMTLQYPQLFQKIEQWTGMNAGEVVNMVTGWLRGYLADKFSTMEFKGKPVPRAYVIGRRLHWDIAVRNERARLGPRMSAAGPRPAPTPGVAMDPALAGIMSSAEDVRPLNIPPEVETRWNNSYGTWIDGVRQVKAKGLSVDMGPMPSIEDMSSDVKAAAYNKQLQENVVKVRGAVTGAPATPASAPDVAAEASKKSVTEYFATGGLTQEITAPASTAKILKGKGKNVSFYKNSGTEPANPNVLYLKIDDRVVRIETSAAPAKDATGVKLINPSGNTDVDKIKVHTEGNAAGVDMQFVLKKLLESGNTGHTHVVIPAGAINEAQVTSH